MQSKVLWPKDREPDFFYLWPQKKIKLLRLEDIHVQQRQNIESAASPYWPDSKKNTDANKSFLPLEKLRELAQKPYFSWIDVNIKVKPGTSKCSARADWTCAVHVPNPSRHWPFFLKMQTRWYVRCAGVYCQAGRGAVRCGHLEPSRGQGIKLAGILIYRCLM